LAALISDQQTVLNHLLPDGVSLEVETDGSVMPVVGNPVALRRLVLNLVVNARDAVADDGGKITITVTRRGGRAILEVADTGPGVAEEYRDRLFEPFFSLRHKGRGAGLGLAVVYAIASAHGGDVELVSGSGKGARFVVRLPPGSIDELESLDEAGETKNDATGRRVMLVEPDGRVAAEMLEGLAKAGYDVRHASDAATADRVAATWPPSAVVVRAGDEAAVSWSVRLGAPAVFVEDGVSASFTAVATELEAALAKA